MDIIKLSSLIILDDIVCSEDTLRRTSEITKLSFSGRHHGISLIIITQDFHTVPKKVRENMSKFIFFTMPTKNKWIKYLINI